MSKFEELAADIRQQIQSRQLKPGDRLPSVTKLHDEYGVSYATIRSAMLVLKAEKLIFGHRGKAVYVHEQIHTISAND
ncbi:winged helix-turn-helix domain-containing protein [Allorhizocola rhizosphaerae]|uniref:winged helix-turn-helix domain-containing protein n=1 Tax=Allorhizocola rhizosphaerae TaxID=1872709 RepID=UPI000E3BA77B|nr:winged helix-turn-helix domain-containing protein [Allorhizocola rhizosphaerae]